MTTSKTTPVKLLGHLSSLKTILILVKKTLKDQKIPSNWFLEEGGTLLKICLFIKKLLIFPSDCASSVIFSYIG